MTNWHTRRQFSTWTFNKIDQYHLNNFEILKNINHKSLDIYFYMVVTRKLMLLVFRFWFFKLNIIQAVISDCCQSQLFHSSSAYGRELLKLEFQSLFNFLHLKHILNLGGFVFTSFFFFFLHLILYWVNLFYLNHSLPQQMGILNSAGVIFLRHAQDNLLNQRNL